MSDRPRSEDLRPLESSFDTDFDLLYSLYRPRRQKCCQAECTINSITCDADFHAFASAVRDFKKIPTAQMAKRARLHGQAYCHDTKKFYVTLPGGRKVVICKSGLYNLFGYGKKYQQKHIRIGIMDPGELATLKEFIASLKIKPHFDGNWYLGKHLPELYKMYEKFLAQQAQPDEEPIKPMAIQGFDLALAVHFPEYVKGHPVDYRKADLHVQPKETDPQKMEPDQPLTDQPPPQLQPAILILGAGLPLVKERYDKGSTDSIQTTAVKLVKKKRGGLNEQNGRDWVRIRATEAITGTIAYTVSKTEGTLFCLDHHYEGDFSEENFVSNLLRKFGVESDDATNHADGTKKRRLTRHTMVDRNALKFKVVQIVLDWFWCPDSWAMVHWKVAFFEIVLSEMYDLLDIDKAASSGIECGIFIPFLPHTFSSIVKEADAMKEKYVISFLTRGDLDQVTLWRGTQQIDPEVMNHTFRKVINQEDEWCKHKRKAFKHDKAALKIFDKIPKSWRADIRMIKLTPILPGSNGGGFTFDRS